MKHRNGRGTALYNQGHNQAQANSQNRNIFYFSHEFHKNRAGGKRLHYTAHNFNSLKQKTEGKDHHTDVFPFFFFTGKIHEKTNKNNRVNIIADFKCHQLGSHGCTDVCTENNGNCLGKVHQACAYKSDNHNGGCGTALKHRGYQSTCQCSHYRISGKKTQYLLHLSACCFLQCVTHAVHSIKEHCQPANQAEHHFHCTVHTLSFILSAIPFAFGVLHTAPYTHGKL